MSELLLLLLLLLRQSEAGLTNVGALFGKMCGGPYTQRIKSKGHTNRVLFSVCQLLKKKKNRKCKQA
jgi:hypothetical protein